MTDLSKKTIDEMISRQKPEHSLEQEFYTDSGIFQRDMQKIVTERWLLIDHVTRIPQTGDYFVITIGQDEIIIIRESEEKINGFFNTCRHRGSRICLQAEGSVRSLVCPYHAWSYKLDGSLKSARSMHEGFRTDLHGLHKCHINIYEGLIFICLSEALVPPNFTQQYQHMQPFMDLHELENAKIAHRYTWHLKCNWKLVVENFFECYHCVPSHPELSSIHSRAKYKVFGISSDSKMTDAVADYETEYNEWRKQTESLGYAIEINAPNNSNMIRSSCGRQPINFNAGVQSETKDGKFASTLMGKFTEGDGATTGVSFNPFGTLLMPNDYAMIIRFTPISAEKTDVEIVWMVDRDAVEGIDYDKENLIWLWLETTEQDGTITENNHAGVLSSRYTPGPYSMQEDALTSLGKWYLETIK